MIDLFRLIQRWFRWIFLFTLAMFLVCLLALWIRTAQYTARATALPAAPQLNDKAAVFGNETREFYSTVGASEDLDKMLGAASLDTLYIPLVRNWNLEEVYRIKGQPEEALQKAVYVLQDKIKLERTGFGELVVTAKDPDPNRAAGLANDFMAGMQQLYSRIQNFNNERLLQQALKDRDSLTQEYNRLSDQVMRSSVITIEKSDLQRKKSAAILDILSKYELLIAQCRFLLNASPEALLVVEKARIPALSNKEDNWKILLAVSIAAFLIAILIADSLDKSRKAG